MRSAIEKLYATDSPGSAVLECAADGSARVLCETHAGIQDFAVGSGGNTLFVLPAVAGSASFHRIRQWWRLGPFDNANDEGFDRVLPPEQQEVNLQAVFKGQGEKDVRWEEVEESKLGLSGKMILAYAYGEIESEREKRVEFVLDTECGVKVWVNGVGVWTNHVHRCWSEFNRASYEPRPDRFEVRLRPGTNTVLVKYDKPVAGYPLGFLLRAYDLEMPVEVVNTADLSRKTFTAPLRHGRAVRLLEGNRLAVGGMSRICILDAATGQEKWNKPFKADDWFWARAAYYEGVVYVGSLDKKVYALDAATGQEKWLAPV
ncbi:MAG: PQQ-binding-like beta-propeller repeat protein, partial [candidate division WOR-3 bacterium]